MMEIDFEKIKDENIRKYGEETKHLAFLSRLYADKTHFIFELLQNAEDAESKKIKFVLYQEKLEVLHDGKVFNADPEKDDVRGICGIDEGTKSDDLTQIGRFGIGFKSIYAYSQVPEVHCHGIHFKIEHYVRPCKIDSKSIENGFTTLFVFPLASNEEKNENLFKEESFGQISNRLQKLSVRTLLFLRNLEEIEYVIGDKITGIYLRENKSKADFKYITVIGQQGKDESFERWIVFSRPVFEEERKLKVEIAFRIQQNDKGDVTITRLKQSFLNVFFPTEKETHLNFLIQGPYRTTPARDNIPKYDDWNKKLVQETAQLLISSLEILKKEGLLDVKLLETLPIKTDEYPNDWMFRPIYKATQRAFINNKLLPTADDDFISASNAKLARGKGLRNLIDNSQLSELFESETQQKWLLGEITQNRTPQLRQHLIDDLDVEEIDPESFARKIGYSFLAKQSDDWHIRFYEFLLGQEALWRKGHHYIYDGTLRKKPIIRCQDGYNYPAYNMKGRPLAFLPVSSEMELKTVAPNIYSNEKAKLFLQNLGLVKPDLCAKVLSKILPSFEKNEPDDEFNIENYEKSITLINDAALVNDSPLYTKLIKQLETVPWVLAENLSGDKQFKSVSEIYMPSEELYMYFKENDNIWFVSDEIRIREELLLQLGVSKQVKIQCRGLEKQKTAPLDEINLWSRRGDHGVGVMCFDHLTSVDGLEKAIETITVNKAIYIWNNFAILLKNFIIGRIKRATRQDFSNAEIKEYYSKFGSLIIKNCWVPTTNGEFKKPSDCHIEDLHQDLKKNEHLFKKLEIYPHQNSLKSKAEEEFHNVFLNQGISKEIADFIINNKNSLKLEFLEDALIAYKNNETASKLKFPKRKSNNPGCRAKKIRKKHGKAEDKSYTNKKRSVRESRPDFDPKTWLRDQYTNDDQDLVCQMCTNEMPFKLKDGSYYFEAIQISDDFTKEGHELYLALCPLCAAKYRYLVKKDQIIMDNFLGNVKETKENFEIPIELGVNGSHSIRFVETHLLDFKIILENEWNEK